MVKVGQRVQCKPYAGMHTLGAGVADEVVVGVVLYVNKDHRWFTVEYDKDHHFRVSFKFDDLGDTVWKI